MLGSYLGTLIAFVFAALLPNRLLAQMIVHHTGSFLAFAGLVLGTALSFAGAVVARRGGHRRGPAVVRRATNLV